MNASFIVRYYTHSSAAAEILLSWNPIHQAIHLRCLAIQSHAAKDGSSVKFSNPACLLIASSMAIKLSSSWAGAAKNYSFLLSKLVKALVPLIIAGHLSSLASHLESIFAICSRQRACVFFSLSSGPAIVACVPNREYCQQKTKKCSLSTMAEILLMFSFGVAHPDDPLFLDCWAVFKR